MAQNNSIREKLMKELREKYRSPREALKALGLDEALLDARGIALDGAEPMKPTRLQHAVLMRTAAAISPLLAMDAKGVDYAPLVKGLTVANFKARKPALLAGIQKAIAGKTIAKDASIEHLAKAIDAFSPDKEKGWDEEASAPDAKEMAAAAAGASPLSMPAAPAAPVMPSKFGDSIKAWAKDKGFEFGEDDIKALDEMRESCKDEDPDEALDEDGEGQEKPGAEDEGDEDDSDEAKAAKAKAEKEKAAKDKQAKDKQAKDKGAMDAKAGITQDEVNKAIAAATTTERKRNQAANEARAFVRPYVGELSMALDSAETILRAAATTMQIEDAGEVHASALKQLIKMAGTTRAAIAADSGSGSSFFDGGGNMAMDAGDAGSFDSMFPGANAILPAN